MLNNFICLQFDLMNNDRKSLDLYLQLFQNNQIKNPIIFTDSYGISIHKNIPIFHSFFLRHLFRPKIILMDHKNYSVLNSGYHKVGKYVVLTDQIESNNNDIFILNSWSYEEKLNRLKEINYEIRKYE